MEEEQRKHLHAFVVIQTDFHFVKRQILMKVLSACFCGCTEKRQIFLVIIALLLLLTIALGRYMFFFQLPWLPEFTLRSNDFHTLEIMIKSEKMGVRTDYTTSDDMEAYKHNFARKSCLRFAISNKFLKMALFMVG